MSQSNGPSSSQHDAMLAEIRRVFTTVERGAGVTLHETPVIDSYGSEAARSEARQRDTDQHWWEVRDEWIETNCGIGGLSFLDDEGFRYYLPAYMSYWLRTGEEPCSLSFHLRFHNGRDFDKLFSPAEKATIATFLLHLRRELHDMGAEKALRKGWRCYLQDPKKT